MIPGGKYAKAKRQNVCFLVMALISLMGCSESSREESVSESSGSLNASDEISTVEAEEAVAVPSNTPIPSATPEPTNTPEPQPTPSPTPDIDLAMEMPEGDALRGRNAAVRYRCYGCHVESPTYGPQFAASEDLPQILERGELRISDSTYEGRATTNMEYIIESIFFPQAYVILGEWEEEMPTTFPLRITDAELANIIAWMGTVESE